MNQDEFNKMVRLGFDEASQGYDKPALRFFADSGRRLVQDLDLRGNESFLDIASGTGNVALPLAERLPRGRVDGVDLSPGMLRQAEQKTNAAGLSNVFLHCRSVEDLDFPAHHFDGMTCGFGVFFWTDMAAALKKLLIMLKPGGLLAMSSFAPESFRPLSDRALERFKGYGVKLPESYSWTRLDSAEKHHQLLSSVGLESIRTVERPMGYTLESFEEWWDLVQFTGFRSFLNQLSPEQARRYREEHLEEVEELREELGIPLRVDVLFTTATKPSRSRTG